MQTLAGSTTHTHASGMVMHARVRCRSAAPASVGLQMQVQCDDGARVGAPGFPAMRPSSGVPPTFYAARRDLLVEQRAALQAAWPADAAWPTAAPLAGSAGLGASVSDHLTEMLDVSPLSPPANTEPPC
jgi:hypothetical protein